MLGEIKILRNLTVCLVAATVCAAPWLFGGVLAIHQLGILIALAACLLLVLLGRCVGSTPAAVPAAFVWLLMAGLFGVLQLVPLSPEWGEKLAPTSMHWWTTAAPKQKSEVESPRFPISIYPAATRQDLAMLVIPIAAVAVFASVNASPEFVCGLFGVFAVNGALFALFGLVQLLSYNGQIYWSVPLEQGGGPFAAFVNRNHAGAYLNLCFAAAMGFLIWVRGRRRSRLNVFDRFGRQHQVWFAYALASICATGVVCTLSRGAVMSFIGGALLVLFIVPQLRQNKTVRNGIITTSLLGTVAAIALGQGSALTERFEGISQQQTESDSSRLRHWQDVSEAIPDYWQTGSGIGTYRYAYRPYEKRYVSGWFYHAENQYFEALIVGGIVGLGLLLLLLLLTWKSTIDATRVTDAPASAVGVAAACLFALGAQTIHAAFDFNLYMPAVGMLFAFFVTAAWTFRANATARSGGLISALAVIATISWVGWAIVATMDVAAVDSVLREVDRLDHSRPVHRSLATRYADKLKNAVERMPGHSYAQQQHGTLLIDLFRDAMVEALRNEISVRSDDQLLWDSTSLSALHARYFALMRDGQSFEVVTGSEAAQEYLAPAFQAAKNAAAACPLSPSAHVMIAQLAPLVGAEQVQTRHAEIALEIRPYDPANLFALGLLDIQAGRDELGYRRWQECLEVSSIHAEEIVRSSLGSMSAVDFVETVMPQGVLRASDIVKRYFSDERTGEIRTLLGKQLQRLDASGLDPAQHAYLDATVLELLDQPDAAAEALVRAVKLEPKRTAWRYELARLFERIGDLPQAREHALICVQMAPNNRAFAQYLVALERRMRSQVD